MFCGKLSKQQRWLFKISVLHVISKRHNEEKKDFSKGGEIAMQLNITEWLKTGSYAPI